MFIIISSKYPTIQRKRVIKLSVSKDNLSVIGLIDELLDQIVANGGILSDEDKLELEGYADELETG